MLSPVAVGSVGFVVFVAKQQFIICSEPDQMMRSVMRFIFLVVALYSSYGF